MRIVINSLGHAAAAYEFVSRHFLPLKSCYWATTKKGIQQIIRLLSRRNAIQSGIVAVEGATGFANIFTKPLWAEPIVTYPGIQLYTVDKELKADVSSTLFSLQKIGYVEVEGAGLAGLSPKEFAVALDNAGLKCHSTHFL